MLDESQACEVALSTLFEDRLTNIEETAKVATQIAIITATHPASLLIPSRLLKLKEWLQKKLGHVFVLADAIFHVANIPVSNPENKVPLLFQALKAYRARAGDPRKS